MNYGRLIDFNDSNDDFIEQIRMLSSALLRKDWKKAMKILDNVVPDYLDNNYTRFKTSLIKEINPQIYREFKHAKRVSLYARQLAEALTLSSLEVYEIEQGGFLHDLGKLIIDHRILYKDDQLSQWEWKIIQNHPRFGCELLSWSAHFKHLMPIVEQHHERFDGSGYPKGLKGDEILYASRILSVVDAYDAMTCNRSYQRRMESSAAIAEIKRCAGSQFDPEIVFIFIESVLADYNCSMFKNHQVITKEHVVVRIK
jgi:Response regulator containing a CheY-like receiver domain and an HD-GYP domain